MPQKDENQEELIMQKQGMQSSLLLYSRHSSDAWRHKEEI